MKPRKFNRLRPIRVDLDGEDVTADLTQHGRGPTTLLFQRIPLARVMADLERCGILADLARRGYKDVEPVLEQPDAFQQRLRLLARHVDHVEKLMLTDMRAHRGELPLPGHPETLVALVWDWVQMQDPAAQFSHQRPPLPGQEHPGLGRFRDLTRLMMAYVEESEVQALVAVPEFYHNAVLYSPLFFFLDPAQEGRFRAMKRDLRALPLDQASFAVERGQVSDESTGEVVEWSPTELVQPLCEPLRRHFASQEYLDAVSRAEQSFRFLVTVDGPPPG